jgi:hypothetical protein
VKSCAEGMETQEEYAVSLLTVAIRLQATRQASCVRERDLLDDRIALFVSKGSSCAHVSSGSQRDVGDSVGSSVSCVRLHFVTTNQAVQALYVCLYVCIAGGGRQERVTLGES